MNTQIIMPCFLIHSKSCSNASNNSNANDFFGLPSWRASRPPRRLIAASSNDSLRSLVVEGLLGQAPGHRCRGHTSCGVV